MMKMRGHHMPFLLISSSLMIIKFTAGFRCHENFTTITSTKCVRYVSEMKTWSEAQSFCQSYQDGNLVSIHSQAEQDSIEALLPSTWSSSYNQNDDVWIGLNDMATEGTPAWVDGTTTDFTTFLSGEPNNGCGSCGVSGAADCFRMNPSSESGVWIWSWGDKQCHLQARFVCQRSAIGEKVTTLHTDIAHTSLNTKGSSLDHLRCARKCAHATNCMQVQIEDDLQCSETAGHFVNTGRPVWEVESVVED